MKIITIGGLPAAGKTYTSKMLAKKYNCISLEFEALRWDFFNDDVDKNLYKYTKGEPLYKNETMRQYYLRCTLYENKVYFSELIEWHKELNNYVSSKILIIFNEFKLIKDEYDYNKFLKKYQNLVNYSPNFEYLNKEIIILSHAFINTIKFLENKRISVDFNSSRDILIERFQSREASNVKLMKNLDFYYASYEKVMKESRAIVLDTTKCNIEAEIDKIL